MQFPPGVPGSTPGTASCQGCAVKEGVPVLVLAGGLQDSHPSSNIQLACGDAQKPGLQATHK